MINTESSMYLDTNNNINITNDIIRPDMIC